MTQKNLIKTFHGWFAADDEANLDTFMVAMQAVMNHYFVSWKPISEVEIGEQESVREHFEYEVNTIAMSNNFDCFEELCTRCMDFSMLGKVTHDQPVF